MSSRKLDDLDKRIKPLVFELLARACEAGVAIMIVDVMRTEQEQEVNIAKGVSWTKNSKHLPQPPDKKSLAIDICPYEQYQLHGPDKLQWDNKDTAWQVLGHIGEGLGLRWGGRWIQKDMGHFELVVPDARTAKIAV